MLQFMLGAPWLCTTLFFLHKLWQNKFIQWFYWSERSWKNSRNVKWPFRTKASKEKSMWMIVDFFHESLLHFIKSFLEHGHFRENLWNLWKVKFIFSRHDWGPLYFYVWLYVPWLEKSQGMCNVVWNASHRFALPPQMGSHVPFWGIT